MELLLAILIIAVVFALLQRLIGGDVILWVLLAALLIFVLYGTDIINTGSHS